MINLVPGGRMEIGRTNGDTSKGKAEGNCSSDLESYLYGRFYISALQSGVKWVIFTVNMKLYYNINYEIDPPK